MSIEKILNTGETLEIKNTSDPCYYDLITLNGGCVKIIAPITLFHVKKIVRKASAVTKVAGMQYDFTITTPDGIGYETAALAGDPGGAGAHGGWGGTGGPGANGANGEDSGDGANGYTIIVEFDDLACGLSFLNVGGKGAHGQDAGNGGAGGVGGNASDDEAKGGDGGDGGHGGNGGNGGKGGKGCDLTIVKNQSSLFKITCSTEMSPSGKKGKAGIAGAGGQAGNGGKDSEAGTNGKSGNNGNPGSRGLTGEKGTVTFSSK